jgi:hypothetical protein
VVAEIQRIAAVDQQDVDLLDEGYPSLFIEAGQRGELQHSHGLPTQFGHGTSRFCSADERPRPANAVRGVPVGRGGNAEGVALGNGLAEEVEHGVVDAGVLDACGCQK